MAATVTSSKLLAARAVEIVTITDVYGTVFLLHVPVSYTPAQRQAAIDAAIAQQSAAEAAVTAYAAAHGLNVSP